jgi:hypothetical protein
VPTDFHYTPHPRTVTREHQGPPSVLKTVAKLHPPTKRVNRINTWLALGITQSVGTMWCAYIFALLALVSLPVVIASGNPVTIVAWIAQTFLQLVLLPVIIVGQNVQAAAADARASATYDDAGAILAEAKEIQLHLAAQDAAIGALLDKVKALEATAEAGGSGSTGVSQPPAPAAG